ncbi:unnamed protein product [Cercopithifilaria johnstoni]|uniref:Large ribosomal subunit protein mL49 n=1 Tax=Cercopithifilaria johnstoni TaxID=2874296 RepID=A0A8J2LYI2_9BILA|nr:unnamed protein product [Cercopithifilaria johnstoni]
MLRHFLKRIRNAAEVKCHCRKLTSEENNTTSSSEVWDDPWQAAMPKTEHTRSKAVEISVDWKYVQRLMPRKLIPDVPKHDTYPTPSGWRPPKPRPDLTFYVERNRDHLLPLYLETRRDQLDPKTLDFEYVELVLVKKIHGDIFECEKKIREYLEKYLHHPIATHVDELKGFIRIKGAERALVEQCLYDFGF